MSITNSSGVDFAMGAGMERSVLARELSLKEIGAACTAAVKSKPLSMALCAYATAVNA